jgi:malonate-semialdehyde dehydrogenase (acetylating)/methylmalonate-semialdehyde dehydrogenase
MLRGQTLLRTARLSASHSPSLTIRPCATRLLHNSTPLRADSAAAVKEDYIKHHSQIKKATETHNFVDNQFQKSKTNRWIDLHDPATQNVVTRVPESTTEEMSAAVDSAEKAFKTWKNTSLLTRQQIMFRLATLIRENMDRLAASIVLEQVPLPPQLNPTRSS